MTIKMEANMANEIKSFSITVTADDVDNIFAREVNVQLTADTDPNGVNPDTLTTHEFKGQAAVRILNHLYPALEAEVRTQANEIMMAMTGGEVGFTNNLEQNLEMNAILDADDGVGAPSWFSRDLLRVVLNIDPPGDSYPGPVRANALMSGFDEAWIIPGISWSDEAESLHRDGLFKSAAAHDALMDLLLIPEDKPAPVDWSRFGTHLEISRDGVVTGDVAEIPALGQRPPLNLRPENDDTCDCTGCKFRRGEITLSEAIGERFGYFSTSTKVTKH